MASEYTSDGGESDIFHSAIDYDAPAPIPPVPAPIESSTTPNESNTLTTNLYTHLRLRNFGLFDEALAYLQKFALEQGFAVSIMRSKGDIVFYYKCDRGGKYRDRVGDSRQREKRTSRLEECPFRADIRFMKSIQKYRVRTTHNKHNHPSIPLSNRPLQRVTQLSLKKDSIVAQLQSGLTAKQILHGLQASGDDYTQRYDIYNMKQSIRSETLQGKTSLQALLTQVAYSGDWIIKHTTDWEDRLESIFIAYKSSLEHLRDNPYILFMDCTYKTNLHRMPLFQIIGFTATNKSFIVAFAFLDCETEYSYRVPLNHLKNIYTEFNLQPPTTILTDKETALMKAIKHVFPTTHNLVCLWHINMNIMKKVRPILQRKVLEEMINEDLTDHDIIKIMQDKIQEHWDSFLVDWYKIVNAKTESEMDEQWTRFKGVYNGPFIEGVEYIQEQWMNAAIKPTFLCCYTSQFFHADQTTTSRGEGAHSLLKSELKTSVGDLLYVVQKYETIIKSQLQEIRLATENDQNRVPITLRKAIFSLTVKRISRNCLFEVNKLIEKYYPIGRGKPPIPPVCTGRTNASLGIPCIHTLSGLIARSEPLRINHFHRHWLLCKGDSDEARDPHLSVLPPQVSVRGRPPGAPNNPSILSQASAAVQGTRREPSAFEYAIAEDTQALQPLIRAMQSQDPVPTPIEAQNIAPLSTQPQNTTLTTRRARNTAPGTRRARNNASARTWQAPEIVSGVPTDMQSVIQF